MSRNWSHNILLLQHLRPFIPGIEALIRVLHLNHHHLLDLIKLHELTMGALCGKQSAEGGDNFAGQGRPLGSAPRPKATAPIPRQRIIGGPPRTLGGGGGDSAADASSSAADASDARRRAAEAAEAS